MARPSHPPRLDYSNYTCYCSLYQEKIPRDFKISNSVIPLPFFVKYLGLIIDKELTWNLQLENANKKGLHICRSTMRKDMVTETAGCALAIHTRNPRYSHSGISEDMERKPTFQMFTEGMPPEYSFYKLFNG
jgi:hypothetical protein